MRLYSCYGGAALAVPTSASFANRAPLSSVAEALFIPSNASALLDGRVDGCMQQQQVLSRVSQIAELEKAQLESQKHMKAVEWAKMELQSATSANNRWKELCDQLQEQMGAAAIANLTREKELHHTIAERNQKIISLRVAQVLDAMFESTRGPIHTRGHVPHGYIPELDMHTCGCRKSWKSSCWRNGKGLQSCRFTVKG
jgi:hypothetical protein